MSLIVERAAVMDLFFNDAYHYFDTHAEVLNYAKQRGGVDGLQLLRRRKGEMLHLRLYIKNRNRAVSSL